MSAPNIAPTSSRNSLDDGDDLDHIVCMCNEDVAICGKEMTGANWVEEADLLCVVCIDLDICPTCGM